MVLSIVGDIVISIGLALQKVAHNRLAAAKEEGATRAESSVAERSTIGLADESAAAARTVYRMP
eukprot:6877339-Prymnesium_polylepis.1